MSSQPLCQRHHTNYVGHRLFRTSHHFIYASSPLYLTSRLVYMCHHTQSISDITDTIYMKSHPVYLWHHIHYIYGIISSKYYNTLCWWPHTQHIYDNLCTTNEVASTLSHQITVFMKSHTLQAWHHSPCIRHRTRCIYIITLSPLTSRPL